MPSGLSSTERGLKRAGQVKQFWEISRELKTTMTSAPLYFASVSSFIPPQLLQGLAFFIIILMFFCFIYGVISIMSGASSLDQGEEGKMKILTGLLLSCAVFIIQGAYSAMGMPTVNWQNLGIQVPQQVADIIQYTLIVVILIGFAWGSIRVVSGIKEMRQDGQGKVKIFSGIIMAAAPWFMYGVYTALGLSNLGGQSMLPQLN